ncbi:Trehalose-6-P synthase/phosphatase complex subunit [Mycoemilia scoparia]|uniref:Trehalose-6-P synthase/phosphatase complex subunit n=1 Tax=Mycoemilia scoparia TaxID=417184 RepID=A0A9W8A777_9FUNG|nr:Trehalose-6-P synthase/phosphatase complex subunit [Mycoemilia scoparia]
MESRVLIVGLFAPYTATFENQAPLSKLPRNSSNGSITSNNNNILHQGRRSSVHRSSLNPLRGGPRNSLRRSPTHASKSKDSPTTPASYTKSKSIEIVPLEPLNEAYGSKPPSCALQTDDPEDFLELRLDSDNASNRPPPSSLSYSRREIIKQLPEKTKRNWKKHTEMGNATKNHGVANAPPDNEAASITDSDPDVSLKTAAERKGGSIQHKGSDSSAIYNGGPASPESLCEQQVYHTSDGGMYAVENLNIGNIGLFNAVNSSADILPKRAWVGSLGVSTDTWTQERKSEVSATLLSESQTIPVYVSDNDIDQHYNLFCKQLLWPLFHYIPPEMPRWHGWEISAYESAVAVNEAFARRIAEIYKEGDIIWVNDYHLMLLPKMIRERLPHAKIGFFMHVPFPSSEIFRCLHVRKQILEGILGADVVGFQTYPYSRHFIQTCQRVLGVEGSCNGIFLEDTTVVVDQFPIGLDPLALAKKHETKEVADVTSFLIKKYAGKKLIVGRDKLDSVKGVRQKMLAYEKFLDKFPERRKDTILIQIALTTVEHNETQVDVTDVVGRINAKYGSIEHQPVVFLHQDIKYTHYLALLSVADAMMVTSLRDGMNLTSHEYVLCQAKKRSPLIMSEAYVAAFQPCSQSLVSISKLKFVGTFGAFGGAALGINPWDSHGTAMAINDALTMSTEDKAYRWERLYKQVISNTARNFVLKFLGRIDENNENTQCYSTKLPLLDIPSELPLYKTGSKRLLFLEYEGVLAPINLSAHKVNYHDLARSVLKKLASDPKNAVYVISEKSRKELESLLGDIDGLSMAAENGCFVYQCQTKTWKPLITLENLSWRDDVAEIFKFYTDRILGSRIEKKDVRMVWDYRKAENRDFGQRQALECQSHINDSMGNTYPIHAIATHYAVEVLPRAANKAAIVHHAIEHSKELNGNGNYCNINNNTPLKQSHKPYDYVWYFGARRLEEDLLTILQRLANPATPSHSPYYSLAASENNGGSSAVHGEDSQLNPKFHLLTVSVSNRAADTKFFVPGARAVLDVLDQFCG